MSGELVLTGTDTTGKGLVGRFKYWEYAPSDTWYLCTSICGTKGGKVQHTLGKV